MAVSVNAGFLYGCPSNNRPYYLGSIFGPLILGNSHINGPHFGNSKGAQQIDRRYLDARPVNRKFSGFRSRCRRPPKVMKQGAPACGTQAFMYMRMRMCIYECIHLCVLCRKDIFKSPWIPKVGIHFPNSPARIPQEKVSARHGACRRT